MSSTTRSMLFIPILLGTAREGRRSTAVAQYVLAQAKLDNQFETELIDVRDFLNQPATYGLTEDNSRKWSEIMTRADGLIIVSPEYNHGYPGELKLMLDEIYQEYNRKPVATVGVGGVLGGGRMVELLRITLIELQMVPIYKAVYFSQIKTLFDEQGQIKDASYADRLKAMFDELVWYALALKSARDNHNVP